MSINVNTLNTRLESIILAQYQNISAKGVRQTNYKTSTDFCARFFEVVCLHSHFKHCCNTEEGTDPSLLPDCGHFVNVFEWKNNGSSRQ